MTTEPTAEQLTQTSCTAIDRVRQSLQEAPGFIPDEITEPEMDTLEEARIGLLDAWAEGVSPRTALTHQQFRSVQRALFTLREGLLDQGRFEEAVTTERVIRVLEDGGGL